jgi:hypothetical protein
LAKAIVLPATNATATTTPMIPLRFIIFIADLVFSTVDWFRPSQV